MDLQSKQSYVRGDCPVCPKMGARDSDGKLLCDECHKPLGIYEEGRVKEGYQAQSIDHWHLSAIKGVTGYTVVKQALCQDCYKKDHSSVYPEDGRVKSNDVRT